VSENRNAIAPNLAALLVVFIWGVNFVFVKAALDQFDVGAFVALRYVAMLGLGWTVVLVRPHATAELRRLIGAGWRQLILVGVLGFGLYIPASMLGLSFTTAFSNSLLIALAPLFMAVLLALFGLEAVSRAHVAGLALSLAGTLIFVSEAFASAGPGLGLGDLISLLAALFYAGYNVANKRLVAGHPASVVTTVTLTIGALPIIVLCTPGVAAQPWNHVNIAGWAALAFSAVFPVYFAWSVWGWVNARIGVARTSLFIYLVPLFGGLASVLLLREGFSVLKLAGAGVILAGLIAARALPARGSAERVKAAAQPARS
jgi:O-acetylserine/cysteine efflux transporter